MKDGHNCSGWLIGRVQQRAVILCFPISTTSCVNTCFKTETYSIFDSESRFGHGRTGRLGCAGVVFVRLHTNHFSSEVGLFSMKSVSVKNDRSVSAKEKQASSYVLGYEGENKHLWGTIFVFIICF